MSEASRGYDEAVLSEQLARLPQDELVAFAASCAERLMPLYSWLSGSAVASDVARVRRALDLGWSAGTPEQIEQARAEVEALVPDEDEEDGSADVALAQSAVACVAYVLRARLSHDVQDAVWAARQLHEAADYIVQRRAPNQTYIEDLAHEVPVQLVLRGLASALGDLRSGSKVQLKQRAQADGEALLVLFRGD